MAYAIQRRLGGSYRSGQKAAQLAAHGEGGFMATILRDSGPHYTARYDKVPLEKVCRCRSNVPQTLDRQKRLRCHRRISALRPPR